MSSVDWRLDTEISKLGNTSVLYLVYGTGLCTIQDGFILGLRLHSTSDSRSRGIYILFLVKDLINDSPGCYSSGHLDKFRITSSARWHCTKYIRQAVCVSLLLLLEVHICLHSRGSTPLILSVLSVVGHFRYSQYYPGRRYSKTLGTPTAILFWCIYCIFSNTCFTLSTKKRFWLGRIYVFHVVYNTHPVIKVCVATSTPSNVF